MTGKKKDPDKDYSSNWGGKRENAGGKPGQRRVGHNGGRKPPDKLKRQRNIYVNDDEFLMIKDYLWNVLRKGESQANRKHRVNDEE